MSLSTDENAIDSQRVVLRYSLILYLFSPVIFIYLAWRALKSKEYREGLFERLGLVTSNYQNSIVIHCASVGECRAAAPLIQLMIEHFSSETIIITTTTPTGKSVVKELFGDKVAHHYLPVDWPGSVTRFLSRLNPRAVILMETELWANLIYYSRKRDIPIMLFNARMSEKSYLKYLKYPNLSRFIFNNLTCVAAQFETDLERFCLLGVNREVLCTVGSIKFDVTITEQLREKQRQLHKAYINHYQKRKDKSIENENEGSELTPQFWLAASIHPDEFDDVLNAYLDAKQQVTNLVLIAVPRHPEAFDKLAEACDSFNISYIRRSNEKKERKILLTSKTEVIVGDTMGEVLLFCGLASVVFVGGSLIVRGGHNPIEPIANDKFTLIGSSYYNFENVTDILKSNEVLSVVNNRQELSKQLKNVLNNLDSEKIAKQCQRVIAKYSGSATKMLKLADKYIQS